MEEKRPRLSPDELQQLRWLLGGVLTLLSVWTVVYLDIDAWVLTGLATAGVLAVLLWPTLPARVPPLAHKLAFPFIVVFFVWDLYTAGEALPPMIRLDLLLLLYRGTSYRQKRDDLQIIVLGLILIMIAGVLTVALEFGAQILVFTAVTLAFLFVVTLSEGAQPAPAAGPAADGVPAWARVRWRRFFRRLREVSDWRLLTLSSLLFVGVVGVSGLLFLAIPRFQLENSFFLDRFMSKKSRTGFSDTIKLGDVVDIQQDDSVALRVDVSDSAHVPAMPYWRMVVLDQYRDGTFRTSRGLQNELLLSSALSSFVPGMVRPPRGPPVYWTFYYEAGISRHLPVAGTFYQLRFREPQWVQQQNSLRMIALRNEPVTMTAYRVEAMQTDGTIPDRFFAGMLRDAERHPAPVESRGTPAGKRDTAGPGYPLTTLELPARPDDQADLRRAVAAITGGARLSAAEFSARAGRWLAEHHHYSLQVSLPRTGRDPVVAWMDSNLPGHCELFTAAFTLLARTAGLPTRIVTGFKGGDWNAYENYFMVRNSNAHAWCEVYDGSTAWFRVDPTDGAAAVTSTQVGPTGAAANAGRLDRSWSARLDAIRILWYRRIVSFDQRSQLALVQSLRDTTNGMGLALREALNGLAARGRAWFQRPWNPRRSLGWLGGFLAAAAILGGWWRWGRPWWWRLEGRRHAGHDPVRRQAGRLLRRLGGRPLAGPEGAAVIADLERLRYGPRATWPEPQAAFRRARRAVRAARAVQGAGAGADAGVS